MQSLEAQEERTTTFKPEMLDNGVRFDVITCIQGSTTVAVALTCNPGEIFREK
jgi:hypothetical protein